MQQPRPVISVEELQAAALSRVINSAMAFRSARLPFMLVAQAALIALRPNLERALVILPLAAVLVFVVRQDRARGMQAPQATEFLLRNVLLGVALQVAFLLVTGCLSSPILPAWIVLSAISGATLGRTPALSRVRIAQILSLWLLTAVELLGGNEVLAPDWLAPERSEASVLVTAVFTTVLVVMAGKLGQNMRQVADLVLRRAVGAREELLAAHIEQAEELTALSGEIAHELKNPLASVKGLASMLTRDLPAGKPAERLGVLRGEVDRMQAILEEFLNFSRPAVPLSFEAVNLGALGLDVAAMHEGMAHQRGVRLAVEGEVEVTLDRRKVRQILINLVQNAIDASPAEGFVLLRVGQEGGFAVVDVDDQGPGLDPRVAERAFEAGVTTKPRGSGLGLTIARALARQQGGELILETSEGGGCRARARFPLKESP